MSFTNPAYYVFLCISVALLHSPVGRKFRLEIVVCLSVVFYSTFSISNIAILFFIVLVTYSGALLLEKTKNYKYQILLLYALIAILLLPLAGFKYAKSFLHYLYLPDDFIQLFPVGISFYTFASIGYLIDVYLGLLPPVRNFSRVSAFISFFPQLTAGPIERSRHFFPQLDNVGKFNATNFVCGMRFILLGLFLKLVISDSIRPVVDLVYADPNSYGKWDLICTTALYAFQVYSDFAGYSLIAIGSAKLLGINLLKNFSQPFLSQTIPDFWRNWHISLSSWVRDYVFSPLQIQWRSFGLYGFCLASLISFMVVGLWHGAGLQFLVFGILHGAFVVVSTLTIQFRNRFWKRVGVPVKAVAVARIFLTFLIVTSTLVLFRSADWEMAKSIYKTIVLSSSSGMTLSLWKPLVAVFVLLCADIFAFRGGEWASLPGKLRFLIYHSMICSIIYCYTVEYLFSESQVNQFIYYKF